MSRLATTAASLTVQTAAELGSHVSSLAWAPDGEKVAYALDDGTVGTLDQTGAARTVAEHPGGALAVDWSPAGPLASGGRDGTITINGTRHTLGSAWVERVAWRPDGKLLAAAHGRTLHFWDPEGISAKQSEDLPATISCLQWHPRGVLCAAGTYGGARLIRASDAKVTDHLEWKGSILELAFSFDGKRLAHGNQDASVHFWDLSKRKELEMWGYATKVRELAWSPSGRWLATGGGHAVTCWDFHRRRGPAGSKPVELEHHTDRVTALQFRPDTGLLASGSRDGMVLLWKPDNTTDVVGGSAAPGPISTLRWSPNGARLAVGTADGTLTMFDAAR